jgi:hypothetical protein
MKIRLSLFLLFYFYQGIFQARLVVLFPGRMVQKINSKEHLEPALKK